SPMRGVRLSMRNFPRCHITEPPKGVVLWDVTIVSRVIPGYPASLQEEMNARPSGFGGVDGELKRVRTGVHSARMGQVRIVSQRRIAYRHIDPERKAPGGRHSWSGHLRDQRGGNRRLYVRALRA